MKLAKLEVLSNAEIQKIHEASLHILAACGVKVLNGEMLNFLRGKGMDVSDNRVRFTHSSVEDALSLVPGKIDVFDREGRFAYSLGGDEPPRFAAGHNAVFWVDSETRETRPSTVADIEKFARICEQLESIDMIGIPAMPQDVANPRASLLHAVKACVENSRKPVYFSTDKADVNRGCIELLRAAFKGDFESQVYGVSQLSPTSPLYWEEGVVDAIMDTVRTAVPLALLPEPNAGVSAPFSLAGLVTMSNAEFLSGLVMIQMLKPGAAVMYASSWTVTDMRNGAALVGSAETSICRIAGTQLAKYYGIPSHTTAPNSDNHCHDEQNAWEKMLSVFCSAAAGCNLIVNCGMFATGMTCSNEQLIMDDEMSAMSRRMVQGMRVDDDSIARDLIESIGPQGDSYLTAEHTFARLRSEEFITPRLAVRGPRAVWESAGSPDVYELARRESDNLGNTAGGRLDAERLAKLNEVLGALA